MVDSNLDPSWICEYVGGTARILKKYDSPVTRHQVGLSKHSLIPEYIWTVSIQINTYTQMLQWKWFIKSKTHRVSEYAAALQCTHKRYMIKVFQHHYTPRCIQLFWKYQNPLLHFFFYTIHEFFFILHTYVESSENYCLWIIILFVINVLCTGGCGIVAVKCFIAGRMWILCMYMYKRSRTGK